MINIITSSRYIINRPLIKKVVIDFISKNHLINQTINIIFIGKNKMKALAKQYKNENTVLPVLTFKYKEKTNEENLLGEIFICYSQMILLAAERNKKVEDVMVKLLNHGLENLLL